MENEQMQEMILLLLLGFVLSSLLGGLWAFILKRRSWAEETRHALYQARFTEGSKFLDDLSELIGRRFFLLQRLWWAIEEQDEEKVSACEKAYFPVVEQWNAQFWKNRNKIRLLVGEKQASSFLNYDDDHAGDEPQSLHYKFVIAHRKVMAAKRDRAKVSSAAKYVTELNWKCSVFVEQLTAVFVSRAASLQLLEPPTGPGAAEQAAKTAFGRPT